MTTTPIPTISPEKSRLEKAILGLTAIIYASAGLMLYIGSVPANYQKLLFLLGLTLAYLLFQYILTGGHRR